MRGSLKRAVFLALLLLLATLLASCGPSLRSEDVLKLGEILKNNGYFATVFQNDSMTEDLEKEMNKHFEKEFQKTAEGSLKGYLFANRNGENMPVIEVFIFEKEADAKLLYQLKKDSPVFHERGAEILLCKNAVLMGYKEVLDLLLH